MHWILFVYGLNKLLRKIPYVLFDAQIIFIINVINWQATNVYVGTEVFFCRVD